MHTLILIQAEDIEFYPGATPLLPDDPPTDTVTPTTIDLVLVEVGATRARPLRAHITGDGILEIKVSLSGDAGFSISPSGTVNLGDGLVPWITIQCSSTAEGAAGASLALTSDARDVEVGLAGRGFESAPLAFEPLNLGQIETGKSTTAVVRLINPGPGLCRFSVPPILMHLL